MSKVYRLSLSVDEVKTIGEALKHLQYMVAQPLIKKLENQVNAQITVEQIEEK